MTKARAEKRGHKCVDPQQIRWNEIDRALEQLEPQCMFEKAEFEIPAECYESAMRARNTWKKLTTESMTIEVARGC